MKEKVWEALVKIVGFVFCWLAYLTKKIYGLSFSFPHLFHMAELP